MTCAAAIAAITNALDGREIPLVFGGDRASFDDTSPLARERDALAACATWVQDSLNLAMQAALVLMNMKEHEARSVCGPAGRPR
jgi:hypothetical protein